MAYYPNYDDPDKDKKLDMINEEYRKSLGRDMDEGERRSEYENYQKYGGESIRENLESRATNDPTPDNEGNYSGDNRSRPEPTSGGNSIASWLGQSTAPAMPDYTGVFNEQNRLMRESLAAEQTRMAELREAERVRAAEIAAQEAAQAVKRDDLYKTWQDRARQSLDIDPNDPIIKAQVDNYRAEQTRALRNLRGNAAESGNSLRPTQDRMATERMGQAVGSLQSELMSRELAGRRAEISEALNSMGGILTGEQQAGLQRELSNIDSALRRYQLGISDRDLSLQGELGFGRLGLDTELGRGQLGLGQGRLDLDAELGRGQLSLDQLRNAMLNQQFYADLGLRSEEQYNYWNDPLRTKVRGD